MKTTLKSARSNVAPYGIEIFRYHSKSKFASANYLVKQRKSRPQTMSDGTYWDGYEYIGYYRFAADAIAAAFDWAKA
jgi:hypothetical protein